MGGETDLGIPFGNETVTLVRRTETQVNGKTQAVYSTERLTGCSWRRTLRMIREDGTFRRQEAAVCRIPYGQAKPAPGDLLILGNPAVSVSSWADYQALLEAYRDGDGAFVVAEVRDNARPGVPIKHYAAIGA